jgi:hypothetical protein
MFTGSRAVVVAGVFAAALFGVYCLFALNNRDCDRAASVVQQTHSFTELGDAGRSDGIGLEWSLLGCTVTDDVAEWHVAHFGRVTKR